MKAVKPNAAMLTARLITATHLSKLAFALIIESLPSVRDDSSFASGGTVVTKVVQSSFN